MLPDHPKTAGHTSPHACNTAEYCAHVQTQGVTNLPEQPPPPGSLGVVDPDCGSGPVRAERGHIVRSGEVRAGPWALEEGVELACDHGDMGSLASMALHSAQRERPHWTAHHALGHSPPGPPRRPEAWLLSPRLRPPLPARPVGHGRGAERWSEVRRLTELSPREDFSWLLDRGLTSTPAVTARGEAARDHRRLCSTQRHTPTSAALGPLLKDGETEGLIWPVGASFLPGQHPSAPSVLCRWEAAPVKADESSTPRPKELPAAGSLSQATAFPEHIHPVD